VRQSRNEADAQGKAVLVAFEDSPERVAALDQWSAARATWATNERPAREAMEVFEELYELRGRIDREGESVELVIGDGLLDWPRPDGQIHHPILLQPVSLQFHPEGSSFTIVETERVVSRFVWKREMAHSSGRMNTTHRPSWRTASGGTRHGRAYQHAAGRG
jgi:hypothetical protein